MIIEFPFGYADHKFLGYSASRSSTRNVRAVFPAFHSLSFSPPTYTQLHHVFREGKDLCPITPIHIFQEDPRATISDAEQAMHHIVLEHFSADSYVLPNVDENGGLTPAEEF